MSSIAISTSGPAAQLSGTAATIQVFPLASNTQMACAVRVPGKRILDGKGFYVRAEGSAYVATAATTVKATLLAANVLPANPLTAANWTTIGAGTARAIAAAGYAPWWIEANMMYDSNGGLMQGTIEQMVNNLFDAKAAAAAGLTGINGMNQPVTQAGTVVPPADPVAWFAVALTFGTAGANLGNLANFELGF